MLGNARLAVPLASHSQQSQGDSPLAYGCHRLDWMQLVSAADVERLVKRFADDGHHTFELITEVISTRDTVRLPVRSVDLGGAGRMAPGVNRLAIRVPVVASSSASEAVSQHRRVPPGSKVFNDSPPFVASLPQGSLWQQDAVLIAPEQLAQGATWGMTLTVRDRDRGQDIHEHEHVVRFDTAGPYVFNMRAVQVGREFLAVQFEAVDAVSGVLPYGAQLEVTIDSAAERTVVAMYPVWEGEVSAIFVGQAPLPNDAQTVSLSVRVVDRMGNGTHGAPHDIGAFKVPAELGVLLERQVAIGPSVGSALFSLEVFDNMHASLQAGEQHLERAQERSLSAERLSGSDHNIFEAQRHSLNAVLLGTPSLAQPLAEHMVALQVIAERSIRSGWAEGVKIVLKK